MAVKKKELLERLTDDKIEIKRLENVIDNVLEANYVWREITISLVSSPSRKTREEVAQTYKSAGWEISFHQNPDKGNFIILG